MNGIKPFFNLMNDVDYALLNEEMMNHDIFIKGLSIFKELNDGEILVDEASDQIKELVNSDDTVFYYKNKIYKVKDEK